MAHGGTNFGFFAGANYGGKYEPHVTSYDYDAPINELGKANEKFFSFRKLISSYVGELPKIPDEIVTGTFDSVLVKKFASVWENLPESFV